MWIQGKSITVMNTKDSQVNKSLYDGQTRSLQAMNIEKEVEMAFFCRSIKHGTDGGVKDWWKEFLDVFEKAILLHDFHQPRYTNMMLRHYHPWALIQCKPYSCRPSSFDIMALNTLGSEHRFFLTWSLSSNHLCFHCMDSRMITAIGCYTALGTESFATLACVMYDTFIACTDCLDRGHCPLYSWRYHWPRHGVNTSLLQYIDKANLPCLISTSDIQQYLYCRHTEINLASLSNNYIVAKW